MKVPDILTQVAQQIAIPERVLDRHDELTEREVRFSALVEKHSRFVFRVAYAMLRNTSDSEDVVQETFLKLYRGNSWQRIQDEKAFLARVAWRVALTKLRRSVSEQPNIQTASTAANPEENVIATDWSAAIQRLVDSLPEDLRQPLALSTVNELSSREIATVMGIAEGTVRTRLMRARQLLKQKVMSLRGGSHE
jgi:RNA polymerase sigma-70 factor, ECF subfamily